MKSIGIDLAGKKDNPTGFSSLKNSRVRSCLLNSDDEIIEASIKENPDIISIDSPLSFSSSGGYRGSDLELLKRGYRVFPPDFGGMESLTKRGIRISESLIDKGFKVIEVHPLTSGRIIFNSKDREEWISGLSELGFVLDSELSEHEVDSVIAAFTGFLYLEGKTEKVGKSGEKIVIPKFHLEDF